MNNLYKIVGNRLIRECNGEKLWIEPWGKNSLRLRCTLESKMPEKDWSLLRKEKFKSDIKISENDASITNGKLTCYINEHGFIEFLNSEGKILLKELWRDLRNVNEHSLPLSVSGRMLTPIIGGKYKATVRFEGNDKERLYGLGQHQEPYLNLKGCEFELFQRNTQVNIPFILSNQGYGFLWNNPAYGRVSLAYNGTTWTAEVTSLIDYWVTAGDTPQEIIEEYTNVTGRVPMMPEFASGFWQSKLRYRTQQEVIDVAKEYKRRGLPISVIAIDFFHWTKEGDWKFDPKYWPDPKEMVKELHDMGIELMVSIWPTVEQESENFEEMRQKGYFVRTERGVEQMRPGEVFFDATNPDAQMYVWNKVKENYFKYGIKVFWLDVAEPQFKPYDVDNIRYYIGPALEVTNIYPVMYAKTFYDGMIEGGIENVINLVRCAWAGSQRYGAAVWSGDIHSDFATLRNQVRAGLNMGLSGIPWWTTDIGGFYGGDIGDPKFHELLIRWFQYGVFCPIFRLHGNRIPYTEGINEKVGSGASNEVWSYGEKVYSIIRELLFLRERLRPYIMEQMKVAHESGTPPMRPLFYDFPSDGKAWSIDDEFMFGPSILVAPVLYEGARSRKVYLPLGAEWKDANNEDKVYKGGQWIEYEAPIETIPVLLRDNAKIPIKVK